MTQETLAMTREDSDSRLMTRDSTRDSAPGKSNDSKLDSHDSCTALLLSARTYIYVTYLYSFYLAYTTYRNTLYYGVLAHSLSAHS